MIFSDYNQNEMKNFDSILENYGVKRTEGIVLENDTQHYAMQTPYYLVPDIGSAEAVSKAAAAGYYVLAPYAQEFRKQKVSEIRLRLKAYLPQRTVLIPKQICRVILWKRKKRILKDRLI